MPEINISNSAGRDAVVTMESVTQPLKVRWLDPKGRQSSGIRVLKSTVEDGIESLIEDVGGLENVAEALIEGDPEVNFESVGTFLRNTSRVFIDQDRKMVHKIQQFEVIKNPDGTEREKRPRNILSQNVSEDSPVRWSGKMIKKEEACRKFVFSSKVQLMHINGLTYDFLFEMAKELEAKKSLMLIGAGPKSNQPLILRRGGTPYRGFLEGRTEGDKYCLILHLSNLELKAPKPKESTEN